MSGLPNIYELMLQGLKEGWVGGGIMSGTDFYLHMVKPVLDDFHSEDIDMSTDDSHTDKQDPPIDWHCEQCGHTWWRETVTGERSCTRCHVVFETVKND